MAWPQRSHLSRRAAGAAGVVTAVLAVRNLAETRLPDDAYVPTNVVLGGALVLLARAGGVSRLELGLERRHARSGLALGAFIAAAAVVAMVAGAVLPATRHFFDDGRVPADAALSERVYQLGVRIPIGTVAFEELAFRGVLLALLRTRLSLRAAVAVDSVLFGLWHIQPTLATAAANDVVGIGRAGLVAGSVVATAVGGVVFCMLRLRSRHLLAPALLHLAFNDTGYVLAWWVRS